MDLTPDITVVTTGKRLIRANQAFYNFFNFDSLESFLDKHDCICDYFISVNGEPFAKNSMIKNQLWSLYMATHPGMIHSVILEKDERLYYLNARAIFLNTYDVLVTLQDTTELKKKDNLLFEQSKLASMGEMIGNIAHQWRQPLSLIATCATGMQLQKEYDMLTDELFNQNCNTINEQAQYLSQTIDDFKNFIKGERTKRNFNLKGNIESFMKLVEGTIKSNNLKVIVDIPDNIMINSYPNELNQCFINIFNNSKDALLNVYEEDRYIVIEAFEEGSKLTITMKDSGGGISKEIISNIFEPYFTTKHKTQGTGLGLHMTYNIISNGFGGIIEASNVEFIIEGKEFKGACMRIEVPVEKTTIV